MSEWCVFRAWVILLLFAIVLPLTILLDAGALAVQPPDLPPGFVYLKAVDPTIYQDIRYAGSHNFLGRPVQGYGAATCILTKPAAEALARVQASLKPRGLGLHVYDCYRPQTAVNDFAAWAQDVADQKTKPWYYPRVPKDALFAQGYIAQKSSHSRGSTVDLTLRSLRQRSAQRFKSSHHPRDCRHPEHPPWRDGSMTMGTAFDCFDELSHTHDPGLPRRVKERRAFLQQVMAAHGFRNLPEEWWHFTLQKEPFPNQYFDFPVH